LNEEYITFQKALQELGVTESQLRAMITRGQLRVFTRGGAETFRRSAITALKKASQTQPTVILPKKDEPLPLVGDGEPLAIIDDAKEESPLLADEGSETAMPTIELPADATKAPIDEEHTDVATQEVSLADEEYLILEEDKAPTSAMDQQATAPVGSPPEQEAIAQEVVYEEEAPNHPLQTFLLGVLVAAMLFGMIVVVGAAHGNIPRGIVEFFVKFAEKS